MQIKIAEFVVRNQRDVKECTRRARLLAMLAQLASGQRSNLGKAVARTSTLLLGRGGEVSVVFAFNSKAGHQTIEVMARAAGEVVPQDELDSLGELVDRYRRTGTLSGETLIRLGQDLPRDAAKLRESDLIEWGAVLRAKSTESALLQSQKRIQAGAVGPPAFRAPNTDLQRHLDLDPSSLETLKLLSLVANKTDNLVVVLDPLGVVEWVNAAFLRVTGYTFDDVTGTRPIEMLCGTFTLLESRRALDEALRLGHGVSEEIQLHRKDGSPFWSSLTLTPVTDESGDVSRWIGIGVDISRRRQAHEALEGARQAAESASRAKSEFLANMSHEIRTPMNAIIGMTDLALATELSSEQRNYLATVKQSADALLELLNDILDLSKIEAGKMEIESIPFDLNELLTSTLSTLSLRAEVKGLQLVWRLAPEVPAHFLGDPSRLRQIVINLVSNAIKFTERGQVVVEVDHQWESDDAVSLHFSVADTGIGIPPDRLDTIFEAFEQADSSTTRRFGGTGLGLTICNQLTRLLGGNIWVQSQVGKGSAFHFSLRLAKHVAAPVLGARTDVEDPSNTAGSPATRASTSLAAIDERSAGSTGSAPGFDSGNEAAAKPLRILVVDDHTANRDLAATLLQQRGHLVTTAVNGRDALAAIERETFDAVLMDVQMPEMDGFQVTAAVRAREQNSKKHLPIIALTAHAMKGDREKCLAAGMDAYLPKPINASELHALVESAGNFQSTSLLPVPTLASDPEEPVEFDFSATLDRLAGDRDLMRRQMEFFLKDSPGLLDEIRSSIRSGNGESLRIAAHRLKGLSASYDAHRAVDLALQLEILGNQGQLDGAAPLADELCASLDRLRRAIQQYLLRARSGSDRECRERFRGGMR